MAVTIDIDLKGISDLEKDVEGMIERASNLEPVLKQRAESLRTVITDAFSQSRSPNGERWPALAPATVERRRQRSNKPLVDTGLLRGSVRTEGQKDRVVFGVGGSAARYAPFHQFGTKRIPRRAYLPTDAQGEPKFTRGAARKWLERTRERLGRWVIRGER
ncbi:MAG: phage virion morphogenesis protein [Myxococcota bacterium]